MGSHCSLWLLTMESWGYGLPRVRLAAGVGGDMDSHSPVWPLEVRYALLCFGAPPLVGDMDRHALMWPLDSHTPVWPLQLETPGGKYSPAVMRHFEPPPPPRWRKNLSQQNILEREE